MISKERKYPFKISIVIPVYNSSKMLENLASEIFLALNQGRFKYEIIFVDDASTDNSATVLGNIFLNYANISILELRKNSSQDNAIMAGLNHASGQYVVIMDDDLQHHPKYIPSLLDEMNDDTDVCYANFPIKKQKLLKNLGSWFANHSATLLLQKPKNIYLSPYKIIDSKITSEIIKYNGPYPYIDGLIFRVTKNVTQIDVEHSNRLSGEGNYTFTKSIKVWANLATNFSILPLRFSIFIGFVTSIFGFILGAYYIAAYFLNDQMLEGWSSLAVLVLFFGGIQLIAIGVIGEYLGRLFLLNNKEPQYVLKKLHSNLKS